MEDSKIRGRALKVLRVRAGLTQPEAAKATGFPLRTLFAYEAGTSKPTEERLHKIINAYHATLVVYERECAAVLRAMVQA